MAKIALFVVVALLALVSTEAVLKCLKCEPPCKADSDAKSGDCTEEQKVCYIKGDPSKESWTRDCAVSEAAICTEKEDDTHACSTCNEDDCNSGSFVTGSIVMSVALAAMVNMLR